MPLREMAVGELFDPNPGLRSGAEWRAMLAWLVDSLGCFAGVELAPTAWRTGDDRPGHASASNCVDIRGVVSRPLRLEVCGVVCVTVNFGEAVRASTDLLLFADGRRLSGPGGLELVAMEYRPDGWASRGWVADEYGEWEAHATDERWRAG